MWQDLKLAVRSIRARPGFAAIVIATLALGIGANTAIFSVVDAVVLRPPPYRDPGRLFFIFPTNPRDDGKDRLARLAEIEVLRKQVRSFRELGAHTQVFELLAKPAGGEASPIRTTFTSANVFDILGIAPALGRLFRPDEDVVGGPRVAVLSHTAWQRRFGGDPSAVGKSMWVAGSEAQIIGVLLPGVAFPDPTCEIWMPLTQAGLPARRSRMLGIVGRLADGIDEGQAAAELATSARTLEAEFPAVNQGMGLRLVGIHRETTAQVRPTLLLLFSAVGLVLLIACANVANLMLARGLTRRGEMAVRAALGASPGRLVRQMVTEGLVLALAGGAAGVALARWGVDLAVHRSPVLLPTHHAVAIDGKVLAFTLAISGLTGISVSLIPAWRLLRLDPQPALRGQGRGSTEASGYRRLSGLLLVAQMALAVVLLTGAGLLMRTVGRLSAVDPGFATGNVLTLRARLVGGGPTEAANDAALSRQLEDRLAQIPGVTGVAQISLPPLTTLPNNLQNLEVQGRPVATGHRPVIDVRYATRDYFRTMGIPVVRGRIVEEHDTDLAVINTEAARRFFAGEDPIGKVLRVQSSANPPSAWQRIVGIVGSVRHVGLDVPPRPEVYLYAPHEQRYHVVIGTAGDPNALLPAIRATISQLDPRFAVTNVETMAGAVDRSIATRRFAMLLLGALSGLALLLATIGLFALMSYAVAQRRKEIGLRMALGARTGDVATMVVREGMALVLLGAATGLAAAIALTRLMTSLLYEISAIDPPTLVGVPLLLGSVALVACLLAARRATSVDPMVALREG